MLCSHLLFSILCVFAALRFKEVIIVSFPGVWRSGLKICKNVIVIYPWKILFLIADYYRNMDLLKRYREIFRKDRSLFIAVNVFYFGLVLAGGVIALASPSTQKSMLDLVTAGLQTGPMLSVSKAYASGDVLRAAWMTFATNLFLGTIIQITLPSLIVAPWALFMGAVRALMWGIMLLVPYGNLTFGRLAPHYLTLLLEGEAYVVAIFACVRQIKAAIKPEEYGQKSRLQAYLVAAFDNILLLVVVALILAVAAIYEAWEVMFFAGIIK